MFVFAFNCSVFKDRRAASPEAAYLYYQTPTPMSTPFSSLFENIFCARFSFKKGEQRDRKQRDCGFF